jgi:hypothetical protein
MLHGDSVHPEDTPDQPDLAFLETAAGSPSENHVDPAHHEGQHLARQFPDTLRASEAPLLRVACITMLGASVREPELRRFALEPSPAPLGRTQGN